MFCSSLVGTSLWQALKAFNLFKMEMEKISMGKQSKSKHKFGKMEVCEVEEVRGYFINLKIENGVFC